MRAKADSSNHNVRQRAMRRCDAYAHIACRDYRGAKRFEPIYLQDERANSGISHIYDDVNCESQEVWRVAQLPSLFPNEYSRSLRTDTSNQILLVLVALGTTV